MGAANPCVITTVIVTCIFVIGAICVLQAGSVAVVKPQYNAGCKGSHSPKPCRALLRLCSEEQGNTRGVFLCE